MSLNPSLAVALEAVRRAAVVCRKIQQSQERIVSVCKEDRSPVTVADLASQVIITLTLQDSLEDLCIVGEEDSSQLKSHPELAKLILEHVRTLFPEANKRTITQALHSSSQKPTRKNYWVLDPLDGTAGFLQGEHFAIALAYLKESRPRLAVMACPNLDHTLKPSTEGTLFYASRGEGAWKRSLSLSRPEPLRVNEEAELTKTILCASATASHTSQQSIQALMQVLGSSESPIKIHSQGKYGLVAEGRSMLYFRKPKDQSYAEKSWDHAAGALILEEAGGTVTDLEGKPLDFSCGTTLRNNRGIVATHGPSHQAIIQAIKESQGLVQK